MRKLFCLILFLTISCSQIESSINSFESSASGNDKPTSSSASSSGGGQGGMDSSSSSSNGIGGSTLPPCEQPLDWTSDGVFTCKEWSQVYVALNNPCEELRIICDSELDGNQVCPIGYHLWARNYTQWIMPGIDCQEFIDQSKMCPNLNIGVDCCLIKE